MSAEQGAKYSTKSAAGVIAGFRYQFLQTVAAWGVLRPEERLGVEVSEDFTVLAGNASTDVQVKNSQAAAGPARFSLQSDDVRSLLLRFWDASRKEDRSLIFLARGGAANERDHSFPDNVPGLTYWARAARNADTGPLRRALRSIFHNSDLGVWLSSEPSDDELRTRLLRRVSWQLNSLPADDLAGQIREQLKAAYYRMGIPVTSAKAATDALFVRIVEVASDPDATKRVVTRIDYQDILEDAGGKALVLAASRTATPRQPSAHDILIAEPELPSGVNSRESTVDDLAARLTGEPIAWFSGPHGVGKSTLARLLAARNPGRWITLDLWPVRQEEGGALGVWRELLATLSEGPAPAGVIIDDFDSKAARVLAPYLRALIQSFGSRGVRVFVTAHHAPSPAFIADLGCSMNAIVEAPYLTPAEINELVAASPSIDAGITSAWASLIMATTRGHPLLVRAKIASLSARRWPKEGLLEDISTPSEAVRMTREEQRRRLLEDLSQLDATRSLEAGQLLRRIATVFDRVDEGLIKRLAQADPPLLTAGDALAVLRGSWMEQLPGGDLRISPLLADIASDVPVEQAKKWRQAAAEYWLAGKILNERTLPLCFWNAFIGEHPSVIMKVAELLLNLDAEARRAVAPLLSPLTAFRTDREIYTGNAVVGTFVRLLQFDVAEALDDPDLAAGVAVRLLVELDAIEYPEFRSLITVLGAPRILGAANNNMRPAVRLEYSRRMDSASRANAATFPEEGLPSPESFLPSTFPAGLGVGAFLFGSVISHLRSAAQTLEVIETLSSADATERNRYLDAISSAYSGPGVLINSGWANEQTADKVTAETLATYATINDLVETWDRPDYLAEVYGARSVILDECLDRNDDALALIESAIEKLGPMVQLQRQRAKVLSHKGQHVEASQVMSSIEAVVGADALDRGFALREAAIYAGKASEFSKAERLFAEAAATLPSSHSALIAGVHLERCLALWRLGEAGRAITLLADTLEEVARFGAADSRQAERSHQYARAMVGLFLDEVTSATRGRKLPSISFGDASMLEATSAPLMGVSLKSIADNWRVLASVEAATGSDYGIDERSLAHQDNTRSPSVETAILMNRYDVAVANGDVRSSLLVGSRLVRVMLAVAGRGDERVSVAELGSVEVVSLGEDERLDDPTQSLIVDAIITAVARGRLTSELLGQIDETTRDVLGDHPKLRAITEAARHPMRLEPRADRLAQLAAGISIDDVDVTRDPALRFRRDIMSIHHLRFSFARSQLEREVAKRMAEGWQQSWATQRFILKAPMRHEADFADLITAARAGGLAEAAALIVAAADLVNHGLADGWLDIPRQLSHSLAQAG